MSSVLVFALPCIPHAYLKETTMDLRCCVCSCRAWAPMPPSSSQTCMPAARLSCISSTTSCCPSILSRALSPAAEPYSALLLSCGMPTHMHACAGLDHSTLVRITRQLVEQAFVPAAQSRPGNLPRRLQDMPCTGQRRICCRSCIGECRQFRSRAPCNKWMGELPSRQKLQATGANSGRWAAIDMLSRSLQSHKDGY